MAELLKYHLNVKWNNADVFVGHMTAAMCYDIVTRVCLEQFNGEPRLKASHEVPSLNTLLGMYQGSHIAFAIECTTGTLNATITRLHDRAVTTGGNHD